MLNLFLILNHLQCICKYKTLLSYLTNLNTKINLKALTNLFIRTIISSVNSITKVSKLNG